MDKAGQSSQNSYVFQDGMPFFWLHVTLVVNVIFFFVNYSLPVYPLYFNVVTLLFSFFFYSIYYSSFRDYLKYIFYYFYILWISFYSIISEYNSGLIMYFTVLFVLSIVLFKEKRTRSFMALFPALAFISVVIIKTQYQPIMVGLGHTRTIVHGSIIMLLVFVTVRKFVNEYEREYRLKDDLIDEVNRKNAELERFAYITSHDLKQPVRNIVSFAGLLERNINRTNSKEKNIEYLNYIKNSSDNLDHLIDDILKLSKLDTAEFVSEEVGLNQVVEGVTNSMTQYIQTNKALINKDNLPEVKGSRLFLNLLFQNLIENAIKYNESPEPKIDISFYEFGDEYIIEIGDNGIGIGKEYYESIFQPFKRLHGNDAYSGSGLGLSICKKIMDIHNGTIGIIRSDNTGTCFKLAFPK